MVLGLLPADLDGVEFRAAGRQVQPYELVQQPFFADVLVQVVDAGVVHHGKCPLLWVAAARQLIQKLREVATAGAALVQSSVVKLFLAPVQRPQYVDAPTAAAGVHAMGLTRRRPAALHVGLAAHARLVDVQQLDFAFESGLPDVLQALTYALKFAGITLFPASRVPFCSSGHAFGATSTGDPGSYWALRGGVGIAAGQSAPMTKLAHQRAPLGVAAPGVVAQVAQERAQRVVLAVDVAHDVKGALWQGLNQAHGGFLKK